jgi:glycosyltransferase involved in cell wall biosynthesis
MEKINYQPTISVIMPVYNAEKYLREAIDSILAQTFSDFEFLIFNDGSTDSSGEIIKSYKDDRIILAYNGANQGYVAHLNEGIRIARGKYIARMDADDIALPERLAKQVSFMENNPNCVLCGSLIETFGEEKGIVELPTEGWEIQLKMLYITPFAHPAVMIRTSTLKEHNLYYNASVMPAEDYDLWTRLLDYGKVHNINEPLLKYRVHNNNISRKPRDEKQIENKKNAEISYIKKFFKSSYLTATDYQLLHKMLFTPQENFSIIEIQKIADIIKWLIENKKDYFRVDADKVKALLINRFFYLCTMSTNLGLPLWQIYRNSKIRHSSFYLNFKLFLKSLLKFRRT